MFLFVVFCVLSLFGRPCVAAPKKQRIGKPEDWQWCAPQHTKSLKQRKAEASLGEHIESLYHKNKLSAQDSVSLLQKARKVGLEFKNPVNKCQPLSDDEEKPATGSTKRNTNAARTLRRSMLKTSTVWGHLYWAKIPCKNRSNKQVEEIDCPFLLPHEWVSDYMYQAGAMEEAMPEPGSVQSQELARMCKAWGCPEGSMVPLGLHGDGVPVQGRMHQSTVNFFTVNLLCSEKHKAKRMPVCCIDYRYEAGPETMKAMSEVIRWSLSKLGEGVFPHERHDGQPFHESLDKARKKLAGVKMPAKATLIEMRSDWDWNSKYYSCPYPNQKIGMCWMCTAKPDTWKAMSKKEREERAWTEESWQENVLARERTINPLFHLPGISVQHTLKPDWMHVVDEGCAALAAGQILWSVLDEYPASTQEGRAELLWKHIQELYKASDWPKAKQLPKLTLKDFKKPKQAPELDVKAAQTRHFAPMLEKLTQSHGYHEKSLKHKAIHNVAKYCGRMYKSLEAGSPEFVAKHGYKFITQYLALEEAIQEERPDDIQIWRARPKFHLLQHILDKACKGFNPKDSWNYRDETFAYEVQSLWFKGAGKATSPGMRAFEFFLKWMNATPFLSLYEASSGSKSLQ